MTELQRAENEQAIGQLRASVIHGKPTRAELFWRSLGVVAIVLAVAGFIYTYASQQKSINCQSSLLQNFSASNAAGDQSRASIQSAGQLSADASHALANDIGILLDPTNDHDTRQAAADDLKLQFDAQGAAWQKYVDDSHAADVQRAANPLGFHC